MEQKSIKVECPDPKEDLDLSSHCYWMNRQTRSNISYKEEIKTEGDDDDTNGTCDEIATHGTSNNMKTEPYFHANNFDFINEVIAIDVVKRGPENTIFIKDVHLRKYTEEAEGISGNGLMPRTLYKVDKKAAILLKANSATTKSECPDMQNQRPCNTTRAGSPHYPGQVRTIAKRYQCDMCPRSTATKNGLYQHRKIHTSEKPFKCSMCAHSSVRKESIISHERSHTGETPYKCSMCAFRTTQKANLVRHGRVHTRERPYKCSTCAFSSSQKVCLIIHERTHTGDKP